jgi:ribonuclease T1
MAAGEIRKPLRRSAIVLLSAFLIAVSLPVSSALAGELTVSAAIAVVLAATLPPEVGHTLRLVRRGGPFPYPKDGIVFGNREGLLPMAPYGFYREYTVPPPGALERQAAHDRDEFRTRGRDLGREPAHDRGARRLVCGGGPVDGVCYYTPDHYTSFQRIAG